jgi:hypothetical protein
MERYQEKFEMTEADKPESKSGRESVSIKDISTAKRAIEDALRVISTFEHKNMQKIVDDVVGSVIKVATDRRATPNAQSFIRLLVRTIKNTKI